MKPFYIYKQNNQLEYSAEQIFKKGKKIFLVESNINVKFEDIIQINENSYDIENNDFYVIAVIDENKIVINYGYFSYCHSLYYYINDNNFYLNLSFKQLLNKINIKPKLNQNSVNEFIKNGFIVSNETLIQDIHKIPILTTLIYEDNKINLVDSSYIKHQSCGDYIDNLKLKLPDKDTKLVIPLSGGFDSTLLTYLTKDYDEKLTLTVGSDKDVYNEFKTANNTAQVLNVNHKEIITTNDWLNYLPQIVEITEGELFEIGLFTCYSMVEEIKKLGLTNYTLLSGDGADQLLNVNFHQTTQQDEFKIVKNRGCAYPTCPKHCLYYYIIKKMEWLLHENNINYIIPYISTQFLDCAKNIKTVHKDEYKQFIKGYLPESIGKYLNKKGGAISYQFFISNEYKNKLKDIINNKYNYLFDNKYTDNYKMLLLKLYIVIFKYIFIDNKKINIDLL